METWKLPAPGNRGCCAVYPTVLIAADRKLNEYMTNRETVRLHSL